ncbi:14259_t:CDS:1, partial [Entrophospora sp. SA101]
ILQTLNTNTELRLLTFAPQFVVINAMTAVFVWPGTPFRHPGIVATSLNPIS